MRVHFLVPTGFGERPSGGNVYDRELLAGLVALGWDVAVHQVTSAHQVDDALASVPDGAVVLVDSLVVSWSAQALLNSRVHLVPLVHMLFGTPGEGELLAAAPAVVVTSEWTRRRIVGTGTVDPRRVHVAVPGVARTSARTGRESGSDLLCVASVVPAKGGDVLLGALAQLTDLDWRCTLVGSAEADPDFLDELRKRAADAGITDRVVFAGELASGELDEAYAGADLLVLPSRAETYGMVVTEALMRGLPVVASAVGGVPEALGCAGDQDRPGMLVRADDPGALVRALRRWLEDASLRRWLRRTVGLRRSTLPMWSTSSARVAGALEAAR